MKCTAIVVVVVAVLGTAVNRSEAQAKTKAAKEAAEWVISKFGREAAKEGVEKLTSKIAAATARHGDDFILAVRKVGPRAFELVEHAGPKAEQAVRLLAKHGEDAAVWIVSRPKGMALVAKHGDDAAAALLRHKAIAEPVIESLGKPAVKALENIGPQAGRRLAMLESSGELAKIGKSEAVLAVVEKYGDKAMDFVWKHKGALALTATLTAFLAEPEAFISGAKDITGIVAENVVRPVAETPGKVATVAAKGVAENTNWTLVFIAGIGAAVFVIGGPVWMKVRAARRIRKLIASAKAQVPRVINGRLA